MAYGNNFRDLDRSTTVGFIRLHRAWLGALKALPFFGQMVTISTEPELGDRYRLTRDCYTQAGRLMVKGQPVAFLDFGTDGRWMVVGEFWACFFIEPRYLERIQ